MGSRLHERRTQRRLAWPDDGRGMAEPGQRHRDGPRERLLLGAVLEPGGRRIANASTISGALAVARKLSSPLTPIYVLCLF
jgi:hypothetical protein